MADLFLSGRSNKPGSAELILVSGEALTGYRLQDWDLGNVVWDLHWSGQRGTLGAKLAGAMPQNRPLVIDLRVVGASADDLAAKQARLAALADEMRRFGGRFTARLKGGSRRFHFDVKAGSSAVIDYDWAQLHKHQVTQRIEAICAPYLEGDPMDVDDVFSEDRLHEYSFDSGAVGDVVYDPNGKRLDAAANLTAEQRFIHTAYGYLYGDHEVSALFTPGTTITGFKGGVILKRKAADTYLEAYVDDNGTNSRLRLDSVIAGARTNLSSTNLAARITVGGFFWVRAAIAADIVTFEFFLAEPFPGIAPTNQVVVNLGGSAEAAFDGANEGKAGVVWIPQHTNAWARDFRVRAFSYRNVALPARIDCAGSIPGDAPARADIELELLTVKWALFAWFQQEGGIAASKIYNVKEAESGSSLVLWASAADANYRGGNGLKRTTAGAEDLQAEFLFNLALAETLVPAPYSDDFTEVEVWARVELASALVSPRLTLSARLEGVSAPMWHTYEFGTVGKYLVKPSSGTAFRFVRLGTLALPLDAVGYLRIAGRVETGSSGQFGLDYLVIVPSGSRALGPTGKPDDASYPSFNNGFSSRVVRADLSGWAYSSTAFKGGPAPSLGGNLIEPPAGDLALVVKASSLVPDDPTVDTDTETLNMTATAVRVAVVPRWHVARAE